MESGESASHTKYIGLWLYLKRSMDRNVQDVFGLYIIVTAFRSNPPP